MEDKTSFQVGDRVLVSRAGGRFNSLLQTEEGGTVLATEVAYENPTTGQSHPDGILVKLQITNTREVFPPDKVLPHLPSSPPATRHQRRARITPSPAMVGSSTTSSSIESSEDAAEKDTDMSDVEPSKKKRNLDDLKFVDHESSHEGKATKKQKKKKKQSEDVLGCETSFRVQASPSSSGKCQSCQEFIRKGVLRLQLASEKRGWYHVSCAQERFPEATVSAPTEMEGYLDLSLAERRLLEAHLLKGESATDNALQVLPEESVPWDEEDPSDDDPPLASLAKKKASSSNGKAAGRKGTMSKSATKSQAEEVEDTMIRASDSDSDDLKDRPFGVEYAATGRAACRGCDERIAKGDLRVAERPLFQGKPGYTVYRHLHCTVFGEQVQHLQDVGGWRRLKKDDRQVLQDRVEESKSLIEKENQELQPDELVQVGFEGEIRGPPKGLSANLLPFQVEGISWMVHQELHVPEIRGGILADEMVSAFVSFGISSLCSKAHIIIFCNPTLRLVLSRAWERHCKLLPQYWTTGPSYNGRCQVPSTPQGLLI